MEDAPESDDIINYRHKVMPLMEAIGYVAASWARLEHAVNLQIWRLSSMSDEDGACITAQIPSILPRLRALIALVHRIGVSEGLIKDLNKFSKRADEVARQRNRIIHDPWFVAKDETAFGRLEITADRKLVLEMKKQTPDEIRNVVRKISALITEFDVLRVRVSNELTERTKEQIESHRGKGSADFLDCLGPDSEPK